MAYRKNEFGLTKKQAIFCEEYLIDFNAKQAAIRSGYSAGGVDQKSAQVRGSLLLSHEKVKAYLAYRMKKLEKTYDLSQGRVLAEYMKIAFFDIRDVYTEGGALINPKTFSDEVAGAVSGIETFEVFDPVTGEKIGENKKVKVSDKRAALDSICRIMGYNAPEKSELLGKDGMPIEVTLNLK